MKKEKIISVMAACMILLTACSANGKNTEEDDVVEVDSSVSSSIPEETAESKTTTTVTTQQTTTDDGREIGSMIAAPKEWDIDSGENQLKKEFSYSNFEAMKSGDWKMFASGSDAAPAHHSIETYIQQNPETGGDLNLFDYYSENYRKMLENGEYAPAITTDLQNEYTYSGHQIYVPVNEGSGRFIFVGNSAWPVMLEVDDKIPQATENLLFEENSPLRLYVFSSQDKLDEANEEWDKGQAILSGEAEEIQGRIILNGRLLPADIQFEMEKEGMPFLSYSKLASYYNALANVTSATCQLMYDDAIFSGLCVPSTFTLPYSEAVSISSMYGFDLNVANKTCSFTNGAFAPYEFKVSPYKEIKMNAEDIANISGWQIYFDGTMVNIVTSKYEATNNFVLKPAPTEHKWVVIYDSSVDGPIQEGPESGEQEATSDEVAEESLSQISQ